MQDFNESLISMNEYSLENRYKYFNNLLFQNKLPENIHLSWSSSKRQSGETVAKAQKIDNKDVIVPDSISITLSKLFKRSNEVFDSILIHEMIHVYFFSISDFKEQHGPKFKALADRFSRQLGFQIPLTDNMKDAQAIIGAPKPTCVILITKPNKTYSYSVMNQNVWNKFSDELKSDAARWLKTGYAIKVDIFLINTVIWSEIAMRSIVHTKNASRFLILTNDKNNDVVNDLIENGQLLYSVSK
jgi:hypothetical protein